MKEINYRCGCQVVCIGKTKRSPRKYYLCGNHRSMIDEMLKGDELT